MKYLFGQVWLWMLLSFLLGALVTWLVLRLFRKPKTEITEERIHGPATPESGTRRPATTEATHDRERGDHTRSRDSALGALDEHERTTALRSDTDTKTGKATVATGAATGAVAAGLAADGSGKGAADGDDDRSGSLSGTLDGSDDEGRAGRIRPLHGGSTAMKGTSLTTEPDTEAIPLPGTTDTELSAGAGVGAVAPAAGSGQAVPMGVVKDGRYPGSAEPGSDGGAPSAEWTIKGNAESMLYHGEDSPYYGRTKAEAWFRTPEDAERAGFTAWSRNRRTAEAIAAAPTWEPGPYENSAKPGPGGAAPSGEWTVKGNVDSMLFHTEESAFYPVTTAEVWFRTEEDAERAGFRPWNRVGDRKVESRTPYQVPEPQRSPEPTSAAQPEGVAHVPPQPSSPDAPYGPGSAVPRSDGSAPSAEYTVKGNADSMLYHTTDSPYYPRTIAEVWFTSTADAERAGFTAWNKRREDRRSKPLS